MKNEKYTFSFLNSNATFPLTSTAWSFFHLQARGVTVRVDHHTHSLLISKAYPYFIKFRTRIRQLSKSNPEVSVYSTGFVFRKEKTYIFCQKCAEELKG